MDDQTPRKVQKSAARRFVRGVVVVVVGLGVVVAALPWLLSTTPARRMIVTAVNRSLAPTKIALGGLSTSWAGSTRLSALTIRDKDGKTLLSAKHAVLDRGLIPLLMDRSKLGTLTLDGASIDVERRADGSIDLVDALMPPKAAPAAEAGTAPEPVAAPAPKSTTSAIELTLRVVRGTLRVRSPELAEPLTAAQADAEVVVPSVLGRKLSFRVRLAEPEGGPPTETLGLDGEYDHRAAENPDLSLTVKGEGWPLAVKASGVVAKGRLEGVLKLGRESGKWASTGDAKLLVVEGSGPSLAGDRLALDEVGCNWDLAQTAGGWAVHKLDVVSSLATLSATASAPVDSGSPQGQAIPDARVEGRVDLAALATQIPHTMRLRNGLALEHGSVRAVLLVKTEGNAQHASLDLNVSDLTAHEHEPPRSFTLRDPAAVNVRATRSGAKINLETLHVKTAFLDMTGSGEIDKGVKLAGTVDLAKIEEQFHDLIDFGALKLAGQGRMAADYRRKDGSSFVGRYAAEFKSVHVAGLTTEPIVREKLRFDAAASGPTGPNGLPGSWANVRVNLKSPQDALAVSAITSAGVTALNGTASVPVTVSTRAGQADVKLVGRWKPGKDPSQGQGVVEFDELRLGLRPLDPALSATGQLAFAGRGWVDLDNDTLQMTPLPAPSPLVLAPEGLKLHGFRAGKTPTASRSIKASLVGDLSAIESALKVWTGREPTGVDGALAANLDVNPGDQGKLNLAVKFSVPDLSRTAADGKSRKTEGPLFVGCIGSYEPGIDRLNVGNLMALTRYARIDAKGTVDDPTGRRLADLTGVLAPNWVTVSTVVAGMTEPKAMIQGKDRAFRAKGPLSGDSSAAILKGLDAEIGLDLTSADVMGLNLGPAPIVLTCKSGTFAVAPIKTSLNNGVVDLKPGLAVDEARGIAVLLSKGSKIEGAEINDEVSKDILSFIAPVLDNATHVHGKFSLAVDRADVPLTGPPDHRVSMTGQLVFQDVVFAPGPFANQVLGLVGKPNEPGLRLHQPVQLTVADGRVFQKGLNLPINKDAAIGMEGSVGFDESLDMRASVPITKGMLGSAAGLDDLVGDGKVVVPIGGTVSHPRVNRQALQVAVREMAKNVLKRDLSGEASKLLDRLGPAPAAGKPNNGMPGDLKGLENQLLRRVMPGGGR